jgi:hypothetical protein
MKINTKKIRSEMDRMGLTLEGLGGMMIPRRSKQATWYVIRHANSLSIIEQIAKALDVNPRDLIK